MKNERLKDKVCSYLCYCRLHECYTFPFLESLCKTFSHTFCLTSVQDIVIVILLKLNTLTRNIKTKVSNDSQSLETVVSALSYLKAFNVIRVNQTWSCHISDSIEIRIIDIIVFIVIMERSKMSRVIISEKEPKFENLNSCASASSVKSKKSNSIISAFMRRTKKSKSKSHQSIENIEGPIINLNYELQSNSSNAYSKDEENNEVEIRVQNYDREDTDLSRMIDMHQDESDIHDEPHIISKSKSNLMGKIVKQSPTSEPDCRKYCQSIAFGSCETEYSLEDCNENFCHRARYGQYAQPSARNIFSETDTSGLPITNIDFGRALLQTPLCDGLRYVHDVMWHLTETEAHIVQSLKKYVKDSSFQNELMDVIMRHSKVQWEAEQRAITLSNDMWKQQTEIVKTQEQALNNVIESVSAENRQLHLSIEEIARKNERLVTRMRLYPDYGPRSRLLEGNNSLVAKLSKNNERLLSKLRACMNDLELYQKELDAVQRHNSNLENFIANLQSQINNLKGMLQRARCDHELEEASLKRELQASQQMLKDSVDMGEVVREDLDVVKRQLSDLPFNINWNKFKCRSNNLSDVLHVCRAYINEMGRELIEAHNKIIVKDKDISNLTETNARLQENLHKSAVELDSISRRTEERELQSSDGRTSPDEKCKYLESNIESIKKEMDLRRQEFETERETLLKTIEEKENMQKEVLEKCKLLEESGKVISNMTSENCELRSQIDGLKRILTESGAGDVARELATSHDKITHFQTQYYQLLAEKAVFVQQLNSVTAERNSLIQCQEMCYQQVQSQLKDMEIMNNENITLKNQLESERATVFTLQTERKRYLEEKAILKTIFGQLRSEISRVQELEGTISSMTKETNRIALIADYNKQLGDKLKVEVEERDNTIFELKSSVEKLNSIQMENTKDKLSLCAELTEVCSIKDKLNNTLEKELQKNIALDETKKQLESNTNSKLKMLEEMQRNERATLKELLRDFKDVMNQRDSLLEAHKRSQQDILDLKSHCVLQIQRCDSICSEIDQKEGKIKQLESKLEEYDTAMRRMQTQIKVDSESYEMKQRQVEKVIKQLQNDKDDLENSIKYLKNNSHKLHLDINSARKSEKEALDKYKQEHEENQRIKDRVEQLTSEVKMTELEKNRLAEETKHLNEVCERVIADLDATIKSAAEREDVFKHEMEESKNLLLSSGQQLENLNRALNNRDVEILRLQEQYEILRQKVEKYDELQKKFKEHNLLYEDITLKNKKMNEEIETYRMKHKGFLIQIKFMNKDITELQKQLKIVNDKREQDIEFHKDYIEKITKEYNTQKDNMKLEIDDLKMKIENVSKNYEVEKKNHESLAKIHHQINEKLVNTVKLLMEEKNIADDLRMKLADITAEINKLKFEKEQYQKENKILAKDLQSERKTVLETTQELKTIQHKLEEIQQCHQDVSNRKLDLEKELNMEKEKLKSILQKTSDDDNHHVDKHVYNETLSQYQLAESRIERLKLDLEESHKECLAFKSEIAKLEQQLAGLEFLKCESTLRIHEMQGKIDTEHSLYIQTKNEQQQLLAAILRKKNEGKIASGDFTDFLRLVRSLDSNAV